MVQKETKRNIRRRPKGGGSLVKRSNGVWYYVVKIKGRQKWITTNERDKKKAEVVFARLSSAALAIREGRAVEALARHAALVADDRAAAETNDPMRLDGLWERFEADPNRPDCGARNMNDYRHHLQGFTRWIAARHPSVLFAREVTQLIADTYVEERRRVATASTVNKQLNALALVWRVLSRPCELPHNPWTSERILRRKAKPVSRRVLTDAEVGRLVGTAEGEMKTLMLLGRETPYRLGDLVSLRWDEVRFDEGVIAKTTSKTGVFAIVPLSDALKSALIALRASTNAPFVMEGFASRPSADAVSRLVSAHFRACGIERHGEGGLADFHSFRHTWISRMVAKGIPAAVVQRVAGHKSLAMTSHYTHLGVREVLLAFGLSN